MKAKNHTTDQPLVKYLYLFIVCGFISCGNGKIELEKTNATYLNGVIKSCNYSGIEGLLDPNREMAYLINTSKTDIILFTLKYQTSIGRETQIIKLFPGDETLLGFATFITPDKKVHEVDYEITGELMYHGKIDAEDYKDKKEENSF